MGNQIYQLLYISSASKLMEKAELMSILEIARKNNKEIDVTGFMLYCEGNIIQLLEGEKEQVEGLFKKIEKDFRHYGVITLLTGYADSRDFPDWSMGFERIDQTKLQEGVEGFNQLLTQRGLPEKEYMEISKKVRVFIETFKLISRRV